jgi:hypothetical protein
MMERVHQSLSQQQDTAIRLADDIATATVTAVLSQRVRRAAVAREASKSTSEFLGELVDRQAGALRRMSAAMSRVIGTPHGCHGCACGGVTIQRRYGGIRVG